MVKREKGDQDEKMKKLLKQMVKQAGERFAKKCGDVLSQTQTWDEGFGTTHRQNGETVVGSTRNTVDTGELRGSAKIEVTDEFEVEVSWEAAHAGAVYYGYQTESGKTIPGRPFAAIAKEEFDMQEEMMAGMGDNGYGKSGGGSKSKSSQPKKRNRKKKESVRYKI